MKRLIAWLQEPWVPDYVRVSRYVLIFFSISLIYVLAGPYFIETLVHPIFIDPALLEVNIFSPRFLTVLFFVILAEEIVFRFAPIFFTRFLLGRYDIKSFLVVSLANSALFGSTYFHRDGTVWSALYIQGVLGFIWSILFLKCLGGKDEKSYINYFYAALPAVVIVHFLYEIGLILFIQNILA